MPGLTGLTASQPAIAGGGPRLREGEFFQVSTGAEGAACAFENHDTKLVMLIKPVDRLQHLTQESVVDRVEARGPVQHEMTDLHRPPPRIKW